MADKRQHIIDTAEILFADKGFEGTSVRDIAKQAGVNLAMISYYFGSKEKLLEHVIECRSNYTVLEDLQQNNLLSPWEKIETLVDYYVDKITVYSRFHRIMTYHYHNTQSVEIKALINRIKLRNLEQIRKIILDGQKRKAFRKVDIEMTISSIMGSISQVILSKDLYCALMEMDPADDDRFRKKILPRLKKHLKQLLRAHLDIKNEEQ